MPRKSQTRLFREQMTVTVMQSGDATIAVIENQGGNFSASGTAKRGKGDKHNAVVGVNLALSRAAANLSRKLEKEVRDFL